MTAQSAPKINLLSKKKLVFEEQQTLATKAKKIAGVVLLGYGLVLAFVMGFHVVIAQQVRQIGLAQERVRTVLMANTALIQQHERVTSRAGLIRDIMDARQEIVRLWQQLQALLPEGSSLVQFSIEDNKVMVGISSAHVILANKTLDIIEPALPSLGAQKTVVSVSRSDDASYRLDFELALKSAAKKE